VPEISAIVPARNGARSLPALLRSLQAQTLEPHRFEVIVVDNGSCDETAAVARAHGVRVITEPIANRARARNRGADAASSRLYAYTDADCVADSRWLEALLANASLAPLVAGEVRTRVSERPNAIERFEQLWRFGQRWWVQDGWAATANLLVHADAFDAVGGFDEGWHHIGEDVDFCFRARERGLALAYCGEAVVEHEGERELRPFLGRFFRHGYSGTQAVRRIGAGYRAWRDPWPALAGDAALRAFGHTSESFDGVEWRRMARLARLGYGARIAGSLWAEVTRAR
jgi:glycosyltransferase involved in cell wall biosynthesis